MSVTGKLRAWIKRSKHSESEIASECGLAQSQVNRFANGGDLKGRAIDKLAQFFNAELLKPKGN